MKHIISEIIGWVFLVMFVALFVFSIKVANNNYKDYLVEYENAQDEIIYKIFEFEQFNNSKGITIYKVVVDGKTYHTQTVEYKIDSGDGFYFVMTKTEKANFVKYLLYGISTNTKTRSVYSYKILVVY